MFECGVGQGRGRELPAVSVNRPVYVRRLRQHKSSPRLWAGVYVYATDKMVDCGGIDKDVLLWIKN